MKRRNFLKIGAASLSSALTGTVLSGCGDSSSPDGGNTPPPPADPVTPPPGSGTDTPPAPDTGGGTGTTPAPDDNTIPVSSTRSYFITEGFITQPDNQAVYFRGYSLSETALDVPAQPFIVSQGDSVTVTINNTLGTDHSFVIDGIVDSGIIKAGESKTISFTVNTPGSYMFYDSLNTPYNRLSGLHGGMAVMPAGSTDELYPASPTYKQQYFWLINDIDPVWHNDMKNNLTPTTPFTPFYFTINGLSMRVPGHPDYKNTAIDAGYNPQTRIVGSIGDRALIRTLHAGLCTHSMHWHANHVEWLTRNGQILESIWEKDTILLPGDKGSIDVIYPFTPPPNALPPVTAGHFPMHFHDEMTQTAGGGLYQFGVATTIEFI